MSKVWVLDTGHYRTRRIARGFRDGLRRHGLRATMINPMGIVITKTIPEDIDAIVSFGILRGCGAVLKMARERKIDWYYIDHAYFDRVARSGQEGWYRVTKNAHSYTGKDHTDGKRWDRYFATRHQLSPWRDVNECCNVLVLPPTDAVAWFFDLYKYDENKPMERTWEYQTITNLKTYLPKDSYNSIVTRRKPHEVIVSEDGVVYGARRNIVWRKIEEDLNEAQLVAAFNSSVTLKAIMNGIPVITSPESCCWNVSRRPSDFVEDSAWQEPDRETLIRRLADNQFTLEEMRTGEVWGMLNP